MVPSKSKQPDPEVQNAIEAALLTAQRPLDVRALSRLFPRNDPQRPSHEAIREAVAILARSYESRGVELVEVAGGWRVQARSHYAASLGRLWEEKPPRYSRALLETLAIIAYRQPVTRGDIESIRGIDVNAHIVRVLTERGWIRVVGRREVPGRPELFATTREFLDYFGLRRLQDLPPMPEPRQSAPAPADADARGPEEGIVAPSAAGAAPAPEAVTDERQEDDSMRAPAAAREESPSARDPAGRRNGSGNGRVEWSGYSASPGKGLVEE